MYVLAAMLVAGLLCNLAVRPVDDRLFTLASSAARSSVHYRASGFPGSPKPRSGEGGSRTSTALSGEGGSRTSGVVTGGWGLVAAAWLLVSAPLAWGVVKTLALAIQMFK